MEVECDPNGAALYRAGGWPVGVRNVFVYYTGGYTTIPADLAQACVELVMQMYHQIEEDPNLKSESLDGHSWSTKSWAEMSADVAARLLPYRRLIL